VSNRTLNSAQLQQGAVSGFVLGYRGGSPTAVRPSDPALCGSCSLVTPYHCRLGDLLCYFVYIILCVHYCLRISVCSCFRYFHCLL